MSNGNTTALQLQQGYIGNSPVATTTTGTNAQWFTYPSQPQQSWGGIMGATAGYAQSPVANEEPRPKDLSVPLVPKGSKQGIFLHDENGNLIHITPERLYKAFCDW